MFFAKNKTKQTKKIHGSGTRHTVCVCVCMCVCVCLGFGINDGFQWLGSFLCDFDLYLKLSLIMFLCMQTSLTDS